jgi:catechol 2,3-dioxygenase-like lactoylglutathione lyase family enzyme
MQGSLKPHFSLDVSDLEASLAFYARFFGADPAKRRPGYAKFDLQDPALNLALVEQAPRGRNVNHFGVQVGSPAGVVAARERLAAAGLLDQVEEGTVCCYARQDKVWAVDPDGNRWEVFTVLEDADRMRAEDGSCCVDAAPSDCATAEACVTSNAETGSCGCSA